MRKGITLTLSLSAVILTVIALFSFTRFQRQSTTSTVWPDSQPTPNPSYLKLLEPQEIVARVGNTTLTSDDLKGYMQLDPGNPSDIHSLSADDLSVKVQSTLNELVEDELLSQEAMRLGLASSLPGSKKRQDLADLLIQKESAKLPEISPAEERNFYKNHGEKFTQAPSNQVRELFLPFTAQDKPMKHSGPTFDKANRLFQQLKAGNSIESMAQKHTPQEFRDKAAGYVFRGAVMDSADASAVLELNPGQLAGPFRVEGGLSIYQGVSRLPQRFIPFFKAQPNIHAYLESQRMLQVRKELVGRLMQRTRVEKTNPAEMKS